MADDATPSSPRSRRRPATEVEARAATRTILLRLFDVGAVVRRRKPLSSLAGLHGVVGVLACVFARMAVMTLRQNIDAATVGTL